DVQRIDGPVGRLLCQAQMGLFDHSALFSIVTLSIPWNLDLLRNLYYLGNPHTEQFASYGRKSSPQSPSRVLTNALVVALAEAVRADGVRFLLTGEADDLVQIDRERMAEAGIPVAEVRSVLDAPPSEVRWRRDSHYTPQGHRR